MPTFPLGTSSVQLGSVSVFSHYPAAPVDISRTLYIDWHPVDANTLCVQSYGEFRNNVFATTKSQLAVGSAGTFALGLYLAGGVSRIAVRSYGAFYTEPLGGTKIMWSNIGVADFTIGKDNIAGERVLDWKGYVYALKKLGNKVIAYGENGVSVLVPAGNTYGLQTVSMIGLIGKDAIAGDNTTHFYIDTAGQLFSMSETKMKASLFESAMDPVLLGYAEYLSELIEPVLSWDTLNNLLYICDGAIGFVYSPLSKSLGKGPVNITGIGWQNGTQFVVAPEAVVIPPFEICTDIYDFGTHKFKTINAIELGTNVQGTLQVAIDYRSDYTADFVTTPWKDVSSRGTVFITALGRELRIRVRATTYEYLELDYLVVKGITHDQ